MEALHAPLSLPSPRKAGRGWPQAGRGVRCKTIYYLALLLSMILTGISDEVGITLDAQICGNFATWKLYTHPSPCPLPAKRGEGGRRPGEGCVVKLFITWHYSYL